MYPFTFSAHSGGIKPGTNEEKTISIVIRIDDFVAGNITSNEESTSWKVEAQTKYVYGVNRNVYSICSCPIEEEWRRIRSTRSRPASLLIRSRNRFYCHLSEGRRTTVSLPPNNNARSLREMSLESVPRLRLSREGWGLDDFGYWVFYVILLQWSYCLARLVMARFSALYPKTATAKLMCTGTLLSNAPLVGNWKCTSKWWSVPSKCVRMYIVEYLQRNFNSFTTPPVWESEGPDTCFSLQQ